LLLAAVNTATTTDHPMFMDWWAVGSIPVDI